ncbi:MAG: STAS/SEC14 domain-containing protein [Proteobacteria bacterium]|nr:STAS/SEC14 domain-containing protein [Pseudomonadota bacterium]
MLQLLPESSGNLVAFKAIGKISDEDFKNILPTFEAVLAGDSGISLLADLEHFEGWEWQAAYDKTAFGIKHWGDIKKIAIVGDGQLEGLSAKVADRIMQADVRQFSLEDRAAALEWAGN